MFDTILGTSKITPKMTQLVSPIAPAALIKSVPKMSRALGPLIVNE